MYLASYDFDNLEEFHCFKRLATFKRLKMVVTHQLDVTEKTGFFQWTPVVYHHLTEVMHQMFKWIGSIAIELTFATPLINKDDNNDYI